MECTNASCSWSILLALRGSSTVEITPCASVLKKEAAKYQSCNPESRPPVTYAGTAGQRRGDPQKGTVILGRRGHFLSPLGHPLVSLEAAACNEGHSENMTSPERGICFLLGLCVWLARITPMQCTRLACVQQTELSTEPLSLANRDFGALCVSFFSMVFLCLGAWRVSGFPEMLENNTLDASQLAASAADSPVHQSCGAHRIRHQG